jgi:hypothetical protein
MWQGCPENARINVGRGNIKLRPWEENLCLKPTFAAFPVGDLEWVMTKHDPVVEALFQHRRRIAHDFLTAISAIEFFLQAVNGDLSNHASDVAIRQRATATRENGSYKLIVGFDLAQGTKTLPAA